MLGDMPDILGIAEASMRNSMQQLDAISRNVANINTQGYKRELYLNRGFQSHFADAANPGGNLAANLGGNLAANTGANPSGNFAANSGTNSSGNLAANFSNDLTANTDAAPARFEAHDFSGGALKFTGSALNMAIEGKGFFQLQTAQGTLLTRDGQFQIDRRGQLVAADGTPVAMKGNVSLDNSDFKVASDGTLSAGEQRTQLDIVYADPASLQLAGPGRYRASATTTPAAGDFQVRQGYLENSNVDSLTETTDMMGVVRHVEATQQLMRAYDEIIDNAVSTLGQF
jgi:flagellar basal-body rod protein FlgF